MKIGALVRGLILLLSLVAFGYLLQASGIRELLDTQWIDQDIKGQGLQGELLFIAIGLIVTAIGLPRQVVGFLGGYAFGFVLGSVLTLVATVGGCIAAFYYARLLGRAPVQARYSEKVRRIDDFLHDNTFSMTLLIRMLPVGSNLITNLAAGVSSARALPFFSGSAVGYLPQTMIFALVGSGISVDPAFRIVLGTVLFVASGVLGAMLYRRHRHNHTLGRDIDVEIDGDA